MLMITYQHYISILTLLESNTIHDINKPINAVKHINHGLESSNGSQVVGGCTEIFDHFDHCFEQI